MILIIQIYFIKSVEEIIEIKKFNMKLKYIMHLFYQRDSDTWYKVRNI